MTIKIVWMACWLLAASLLAGADRSLSADVVIYGGTAGGLAAAEAVVREGASVIVVEPTNFTGGMVTGGIAITDTGTPDLVGGIAAAFFDQVAAEEQKVAKGVPAVLRFQGKDIPWRKPRSWDFEPKVARAVFDEWIARGGYKVLRGKRVASVEKTGASITGMKLEDGTRVAGEVFVDASYEGDLMARAGVSNTYGRESRQTYGEKLAGIREPHFVKNYSEEEYGIPTIAYMHPDPSLAPSPD